MFKALIPDVLLTITFIGRAALQKRIMVMLRKIEHCVNGVQPAWEETFMNWNSTCKNLASHTKAKVEDGQMEPFHRSMGKRRASHQNSEHELEVRMAESNYLITLRKDRSFKDQINEWANMTGFLCALGGVCLQRKSPSRPTLSTSSHSSYSSLSTVTVSSMGTVSSVADSRKSSVLTGNTQEQRQYCPVTQ